MDDSQEFVSGGLIGMGFGIIVALIIFQLTGSFHSAAMTEAVEAGVAIREVDQSTGNVTTRFLTPQEIKEQQ